MVLPRRERVSPEISVLCPIIHLMLHLLTSEEEPAMLVDGLRNRGTGNTRSVWLRGEVR